MLGPLLCSSNRTLSSLSRSARGARAAPRRPGPALGWRRRRRQRRHRMSWTRTTPLRHVGPCLCCGALPVHLGGLCFERWAGWVLRVCICYIGLFPPPSVSSRLAQSTSIFSHSPAAGGDGGAADQGGQGGAGAAGRGGGAGGRGGGGAHVPLLFSVSNSRALQSFKCCRASGILLPDSLRLQWGGSEQAFYPPAPGCSATGLPVPPYCTACTAARWWTTSSRSPP